MHFRSRLALPLWFACAAFHLSLSVNTMAETPPIAPLRPVVDDYFGTKITDNYRYMEEFTNPEVQKWVKGQAEYAEHTLNAIPGRAPLLKRIDELDAGAPYSIWGLVHHPLVGLFYFKQKASEDVAKVYTQPILGLNDTDSLQRERLLVDPETFPKAERSDHFTLSFFRVAPDGTHLLYGYAASGSEQTSLAVLNIKTGKNLPDVINRLEAEYALPSWSPDSKSFYYSRRRKLGPNDPPTEGYKFTQAFKHTLGDDVEKDPLVFGRGAVGSPEFEEMDFPAVLIPVGSKWAIGQVKHGDETDITLYTTLQADLGKPEVKWTKVCDRADLVTEFAVRDDDIYLLTALNAPRFQVLRTSLAKPDTATAAVVVGPDEYVVDSVAVAQDALYVGILNGVPNKILRVPYADGAKTESIELPADEPSGTIEFARPDMPSIILRTRSWIREGALYGYDPATKVLTDTGLMPPGKYDVPEGLAATEVQVASHDGVLVPLSIIHRADIKLDGLNPTVISGYGAYGHTAAMGYDPTMLAWLERGGVIAIAHVRGGGAFGKSWHHAGRKSTKPNTWRDFLSCAEYLVKQGYTSPAKLAGRGGSAGGDSHRPGDHRTARVVRGGEHCGRLHRHAPLRDDDERPTERPRVRHDLEGRRVPRLAGDEHVATHPRRRALSGRDPDARHQRPARRTMAIGQNYGPTASGRGKRRRCPAGTLSGRLPRRPRHRQHSHATPGRESRPLVVLPVAVRRGRISAGEVRSRPSALPAANFRALEVDLNPINRLQTADDRAGREVDSFGDLLDVLVDHGVEAAL